MLQRGERISMVWPVANENRIGFHFRHFGFRLRHNVQRELVHPIRQTGARSTDVRVARMLILFKERFTTANADARIHAISARKGTPVSPTPQGNPPFGHRRTIIKSKSFTGNPLIQYPITYISSNARKLSRATGLGVLRYFS